MKIAILTMGTRGDIQPYAVLGQYLRERGHEVSFATARNFRDLVESYGLRFVPVEADMQAVLEGEEGKKMLKGNPFAIRRNLHTWVYPLVTSSLLQFYELAQQQDLVLYHVKTLADTFADQFPQKMIRASVLPIIEPTASFPNPAFSGIPIPSFLNRFSYKLSSMSIRMLSKPVGDFREKAGLPRKYKSVEVRNIYGLSQAFLPVPKDYSTQSCFTGFWFKRTGAVLSAELENFLASGDPPLLLTFGSMPFKVNFDIQASLLRISEATGLRMIVVRGWGFEQTERLEQSGRMIVVGSVPYEALFPRVKAIVHHGGVGTTAECLRAGKPFFICPVMYPIGDQLFWGNYARSRGVSIRPIPLKKLTDRSFTAGITELVTKNELYENAKRLGETIGGEDGLGATCDQIEEYYRSITV